MAPMRGEVALAVTRWGGVAKRRPHGAASCVAPETQMRFARPIFSALVATFLFAGLVQACSSSAGQTCRKSSDCESGLLCCGTGAVVTGGARGTCQAACTVVVDAGSDSGSVSDGSVDAGGDMGSEAGVDAGMDAGVDASDIDASVDAGTD